MLSRVVFSTGTLSEPKVEVGQAATSLLQDVVESLGDEDVDLSQLLQKAGELGARLRERRQRRAEERANNAGEDAAAPDATDTGNSGPADGANEAESDRPRLLDRIRERGGLFRRKDR